MPLLQTLSGLSTMYNVLRGNTKKQSGFTLVELMVAISIVAVLSAVGFTLFQSTQASARDAKRRADVDAMSTALETHYNAESGVYAALDDSWFSDKKIPTDPLNSGGYAYSVTISGDNSSYVDCAKLERGGGNYSDQGVTPASGTSAVYYCKLNQQQ